MTKVGATNQICGPEKRWSIKFRKVIGAPFSFRRKQPVHSYSAQYTTQEGSTLADEGIALQPSSDFGLITARLGLLFTRLAATQNPIIKQEDLKLIEEGRKYFSELLNVITSLQKGESFAEVSRHLDYLSFVENGPQKLKSLGPIEILQNKINDMGTLLKNQGLREDVLKGLAELFLTISGWTIEEDTSRYFSNISSPEFKSIP